MSYGLQNGKPFDYNFVREFQDGLITEIIIPFLILLRTLGVVHCT